MNMKSTYIYCVAKELYLRWTFFLASLFADL